MKFGGRSPPHLTWSLMRPAWAHRARSATQILVHTGQARGIDKMAETRWLSGSLAATVHGSYQVVAAAHTLCQGGRCFRPTNSEQLSLWRTSKMQQLFHCPLPRTARTAEGAGCSPTEEKGSKKGQDRRGLESSVGRWGNLRSLRISRWGIRLVAQELDINLEIPRKQDGVGLETLLVAFL